MAMMSSPMITLNGEKLNIVELLTCFYIGKGSDSPARGQGNRRFLVPYMLYGIKLPLQSMTGMFITAFGSLSRMMRM